MCSTNCHKNQYLYCLRKVWFHPFQIKVVASPHWFHVTGTKTGQKQTYRQGWFSIYQWSFQETSCEKIILCEEKQFQRNNRPFFQIWSQRLVFQSECETKLRQDTAKQSAACRRLIGLFTVTVSLSVSSWISFPQCISKFFIVLSAVQT